MKILEWKRSKKPLSKEPIKEFALSLISIVIAVCFLFYIIKGFLLETELLFINKGDLFFIKENSTRIPAALTLFFWAYFLVGFFQKIIGFDSEYSIKMGLKCGLISILLCICILFPFNWIAESNLKSKGYIYCNWYTGASFRAPDVWLKNDELCLQDGSVIISDIYDWFEMHNEKGVEPTLNELEAFIKKTRTELGR